MTDSTDAAGPKGGRPFMVFLVGLTVGVAGTIFLPDLLSPYLPQSLRGAEEDVAGVVTAKERQQDQLLLTVDSRSGAVLATFSRKVAEIALLVDEGDSVTLSVETVEPFVDDPTIRRVQKRRAGSRMEPASPAADGTPPETSPADAPEDAAAVREGAEDADTSPDATGSPPDSVHAGEPL